MTVTKELKDSILTITVKGSLNTATSPILEQELENELDGITTLIIDCAELDYVSSSGLRIFLATKKQLKDIPFILRNVKEEVYEVLEMVGFIDILTIER